MTVTSAIRPSWRPLRRALRAWRTWVRAPLPLALILAFCVAALFVFSVELCLWVLSTPIGP